MWTGTCIDLSSSEILSGSTRCIRARCMITNWPSSIICTAQCCGTTGAIYMEMVATTGVGNNAWATVLLIMPLQSTQKWIKIRCTRVFVVLRPTAPCARRPNKLWVAEYNHLKKDFSLDKNHRVSPSQDTSKTDHQKALGHTFQKIFNTLGSRSTLWGSTRSFSLLTDKIVTHLRIHGNRVSIAFLNIWILLCWQNLPSENQRHLMIIALGVLNWSTEGGRWEATVGIPEVARMDHQQQAQRCVISQDMEGKGERGGVGEDGWHSLTVQVDPTIYNLYHRLRKCISKWQNSEESHKREANRGWRINCLILALNFADGNWQYWSSPAPHLSVLHGGSSCLNDPSDWYQRATVYWAAHCVFVDADFCKSLYNCGRIQNTIFSLINYLLSGIDYWCVLVRHVDDWQGPKSVFNQFDWSLGYNSLRIIHPNIGSRHQSSEFQRLGA